MENIFLLIDASEKYCSVSLFRNNNLIIESQSSTENDASSTLTLLIKKIVDESNISLNQISCIGVFSGPGSYTGLRIAVSTAKGLCYSLNTPLISINTLEAMAYGFVQEQSEFLKKFKNALILPMIDARRMEVYTCGYSTTKKKVFPLKAQILNSEFFNSLETEDIICFGSGSEKCKEISTNFKINIVDNFKNKSSYGIHSFLQKISTKKFEDIAYFEPLYLKEFYTKPRG